LTIWAWPKRTVKGIIEDDPNFGVIILGILVGITAALRSSVLNGLHPLPDLIGHNTLLDDIINVGIGHSPGIFMTAASIIIFGSVMGVVLVLLGGFLLRLGGLISGGHGLSKNIRTVVAWSFAPYTILFPIWVLVAIFNAGDFRQLGIATSIAMSSIGWYLPVLFFLDNAIRILCLTYLIISLADVHKISPIRSVAVVLIAFVPLTLVVIPWQGFHF